MSFVWGDNGAQLTPEAIAAQRKVAQVMLAQGGDFSPIRSPWQGAARVAQALVGGLNARSADEAERVNASAEKDLLARVTPGAAATPAAAMAPAPAPAVSPSVSAPMGATQIPANTVETRGFRNMNPGNIEDGPFAQGLPGYAGTDGRFAKFASLDEGKAAIGKLLDSYERRGINTPGSIINRWAPPTDNNPTTSYANGVASTAGIGVNDVVRPEHRAAIVDAIIKQENGRTAPIAAAPATAAVQAQAQPSLNPAILQGMTSPYVSDGTKKVLGILMQNQLQADAVTQVDLGNKIGVMDKRGNIIRTIEKGEPNKGPTFEETGQIDQQTGEKIKGWINPRDMSVQPYRPQGATPAQPSTIPAVPPGVDPKIWREGQSKSTLSNALPASFDDTSKARSEFQGLPSYKNLAQAAPIYRSMSDAAGRNTKAADLNMVYGLGKIMDPGSVVREGEIQMANNAQGWQEKLNGIVAQINNQGGLTPEGRKALMAEAHSRITAYKNEYDQSANHYRGVASRNRMNPDDIVQDFGKFDPWDNSAKSTGPAEVDGYKIKAR